MKRRREKTFGVPPMEQAGPFELGDDVDDVSTPEHLLRLVQALGYEGFIHPLPWPLQDGTWVDLDGEPLSEEQHKIIRKEIFVNDPPYTSEAAKSVCDRLLKQFKEEKERKRR